MKSAVVSLVLVLAVLSCGCATTGVPGAVPASAASVPDLRGTWTGTMLGYDEGSGFSDYGGATFTMNVSGQQGRLFAGELRFTINGTPYSLPVAGVIGRDNRSFTLTEQDSGYSSGTILSENELELQYLHDRQPISAAIDTLRRQ